MALDPQVIAVVKAWGKAKDSAAGAQVLADAKRRLSPELAVQLIGELADISAELLLVMLTREDGLDPAAEPVDINGTPLHPKQAERLGAWLEDQQKVAGALGLALGPWQKALESAMSALGEKTDNPDLTAAAADAQKWMGAVSQPFQNRPTPGSSPKAGLSGLLGARGFPGKKK